jgi:hypothetical protein
MAFDKIIKILNNKIDKSKVGYTKMISYNLSD